MVTSFNVKSTAELISAVKNAHDGDHILLASGTYAGVNLKNININGNVTITSVDADHPAVLSDLLVKGSSGLSFANLDFTVTESSSNFSFQVFGSSRINFDHIEVEGPANLGSGAEISPFMIRASNNVTVTNSEFSNVWHGISLLNNDGISIANNSFHDIRTDGVRGGGNSNLSISNNMFTDFFPAEGDHPDAIQLWTTNTTETSHDISITNNLVVRGDGAPVQGIFLRDTFDKMPFSDVTITGNLIAGGLYNGIAVDGVNNGLIANNVVAGFADQKSWIRTRNDTGLVVVDNEATAYSLADQEDARIAANLTTQSAEDGGARAVTAWLAQQGDFASHWGSAQSVLERLGLVTSSEPEAKITLVTGTGEADRLTASEHWATRLESGNGNDSLTGSASQHSELVGGNGNDIYKVLSADTLIVETAKGGTDTVYASVDYVLADHIETLRLAEEGLTGTGNALDNRMVGTAGADRFFGMDGKDMIQGADGNDMIAGGNGNDELRGDAGDDVLLGDAGDDTLLGGLGDDQLSGGDGKDIIEGGIGDDVLTGGKGSDQFRFRAGDFADNARDRITDFVSGVDDLNLSAIDANSRTSANDGFRFIGTAAFHKVAGELNYSVSGGSAFVSGDTNGDGIADFTIELTNVTKLVASDFML